MTWRKSGWGLVNDNPNEVDLSEWGGVAPSCEIASWCPVCINNRFFDILTWKILVFNNNYL